MSNSAKYLKSLADHFAPRDWEYTRQHKIEHIRYEDDFTGKKSRLNRFHRGLKSAFGKLPGWEKTLLGKRTWAGRYYTLLAYMQEKNIPDGVLNNGGVITYWEEDGEYIQMVQPSVGSLLADFLLAEPKHPHAVIIRAELDRIRAGYKQRIREKKVS